MCNQAIYKKGVIVFSSDLDPAHFFVKHQYLLVLYSIRIHLQLKQNLKCLNLKFNQNVPDNWITDYQTCK